MYWYIFQHLGFLSLEFNKMTCSFSKLFGIEVFNYFLRKVSFGYDILKKFRFFEDDLYLM